MLPWTGASIRAMQVADGSLYPVAISELLDATGLEASARAKEVEPSTGS